MTRRLTLGTAGHVDHGKTSLVRRLTGTDTDRLEEERRRGISIVLGYALLDLPDGTRLSVVDVPGHERFVRTMVGGATGIDLALVCVAADDGVMPQTVEHLAILGLLGVRRGVVALTKADLVDPARLAEAETEARAALAATPLAGAPIVAVSSETGEGLDALVGALAAEAAATPSRPATGRARLPIDRAFSLTGIGTVVTGTLGAGTLRTGDAVRIEPGGAEARIRSLEVHGEAVDEAPAGSRVAAALVGVERADAAPGCVLWDGPPARPGYRLDVAVDCLPGSGGLARGELVEVLHGTAVAHARVVPLEGDAVPDAGSGLAQLRLVEPVAALRGDRIVIRRLAPPGTVAGARVLDPQPPRHTGTATDLARLRLYAGDDPAAIARAALAAGAVRAADLVARGLLEPAAAAGALDRVEDAVALGDWRLSGATHRRIADVVHERLATRRAEHPHDPVVPIGALLRDTPWRDALVERLVADGVAVREGAGLRLPGEAAAEPPEAARALLAELAAAPFATHRQAELVAQLPVPADDGWAILARLDRDGLVARLPDGLVVDRAAYDEAVRIVRATCERTGEIALAELRDATGSSRKVVQALLERMDADGITRRTGDVRILRRGAARD